MSGPLEFLGSSTPGAVSATNRLPVATAAFVPVGAHSSGRVITAATTLTPPAGATRVLLSTTGQDVRFTLDGTAPTASVGFIIKVDQPPILIDVPSGVTLKVIQVTATASLQEQWGQ